jgi:hypothetical protein
MYFRSYHRSSFVDDAATEFHIVAKFTFTVFDSRFLIKDDLAVDLSTVSRAFNIIARYEYTSFLWVTSTAAS